jgi:hypothetical protein
VQQPVVASLTWFKAPGIVDITVLHVLRRGEPELSPSLETESSSLGDSSRMACSDGDPL